MYIFITLACPGCIFPWKYYHGGPTYNGCANPDDGTGGNWCSTKLNNHGNHIYGNWKYCDEGCPVHVNDNDQKFSDITELHPYKPTNTDTSTTIISYENCNIT